MAASSKHNQYLLLFVCIFIPLLYFHRSKLSTQHIRWDGHLPVNQRTVTPHWGFHIAINSADECELALLENIGPTLANRIIQTRQQLPQQKFQSVEQLLYVKGVGTKTLAKLRQHIVCD